jgi:hypothetical protein
MMRNKVHSITIISILFHPLKITRGNVPYFVSKEPLYFLSKGDSGAPAITL